MDNPLFEIDIKKENITIELNAGSRGLQGNPGPPGEKGDPGDDLRILDSYQTEEALKKEHPTGFVGDAYLINMDLYIWSNQEKDWINTGTIQGPPGQQGIQGNPGPPGEKGDKPTKGVDYFTEEEINEILQEAKDYTDNEIATFDFIKIVQELPESGLINRTYFVPKISENNNDLYDEYMWINEAWECLGTKQIEVDLTDYYNKTEVDEKIEEHSVADYDSLPVGSVVDFEGEEIPVGYEEVSSNEKILWTNPNPTEAFGSQTITLSSDNYEELIWYFVSDVNTETPVTITTISIKKHGTQPFFSSSASLKYWVRRITYNSNTSYTVEDTKIIDNSGVNIANTMLVPLYVVGKKTDLFS